jgi:hypothetical protein
MIQNFICETCDKENVCKLRDILFKFHEDAKHNLGIDITMNKCLNYKECKLSDEVIDE